VLSLLYDGEIKMCIIIIKDIYIAPFRHAPKADCRLTACCCRAAQCSRWWSYSTWGRKKSTKCYSPRKL